MICPTRGKFHYAAAIVTPNSSLEDNEMSDDPIIAEIHRIRERIWMELCHENPDEIG